MSPKAIQARAGAGQGSMYHHFSGKADLAAAALAEMTDSFRKGVDLCLDQKGSPIERLCGYMLRSREALRGCQIGSLSHDAEIVQDERLRRPLQETFTWLLTRLSEVIRLAQEQGELSSVLRPHELAAALIAVIQGGYVLARSSGDSSHFNRAVRGAVALLKIGAPSYPAAPGQVLATAKRRSTRKVS